MTDKIEPWIRKAAFQIDNYIEHHDGFTGRMATISEIIATHAPKQEPSVPVSELKAWRNTASIPLTYSDAVAFDELIHQAEGEK